MLARLRLLRSPLGSLPRHFIHFSQPPIMSKRPSLDLSPPVVRGMKELDREAFKKTVTVLSVKVPKQLLVRTRCAAQVRGCVYAFLAVCACH